MVAKTELQTSDQMPRQPRRRNLTARQIDALPRKRQRYTMADPEQRGLYLRVPPSGPIIFVVAERNPYGRKVWAKIGSTADMDIDEARDRARVVIRRLKDGLPAFEPTPEQPASYRAVAEKWLELHVGREGLRSHTGIKWLLNKFVLPFWENREFVSIRRRDINDLLDNIAGNPPGMPIMSWPSSARSPTGTPPATTITSRHSL